MRRIALSAHILLVLLVATRQLSALSLLLAAVLILPLPGMIRAKSYTFAWASMMVAFYVAGYLAAGYADPASKFSLFAIASVAAIDYVCLMLYVRFLARENAATREAE